MNSYPPVPYPAIKHHGVIGDRRTAALVAADGTIDWLPLPDYDGNIIFGALLDAEKGGYWYLGPATRCLGNQSYVEDTTSLVTAWDLGQGRLELTDVMPWPADRRPAGREKHRVVLRRLRCVKGSCSARLLLRVACDFQRIEPMPISEYTVSLRTGSHDLELWNSRPVRVDSSGVGGEFQLHEGEEVWGVLALGHRAADWNEKHAAERMAETERYWKEWADKLSYQGPRQAMVRRSAILVHQLSYAPDGSHVAAPTTSLPERIGGAWNFDYRFSWLRDTSLSLETLTFLGDKRDARRYLEWLSSLVSRCAMPLQVVYGIHGEKNLTQTERKDVQGYRGSKPVQFGNRAYAQNQHGSVGYLVSCIYGYLLEGGQWRPEFWELVRCVADYIAAHWKDKSSGIWELPVEQHYLSDKVLGWLGLDRAVRIAKKLGKSEGVEHWCSVRDELHADVMERGWCESLGAFRQRYESDNLDAAGLLIPLVGFLPPDHPRVKATVDKVVELLTINGFVYRFDPLMTPGMEKHEMPLGESEGAFLPCTFWLATVFAQMGRLEEAESILDRAEAMAGPLGLFAECADARSGDFLGNYPLLFSQIEYVRAVRTLAGLRNPPHD